MFDVLARQGLVVGSEVRSKEDFALTAVIVRFGMWPRVCQVTPAMLGFEWHIIGETVEALGG